MEIIKKNLNLIIEANSLNALKEISKEIQDLNEKFRGQPLPQPVFDMIKYYAKIVNEWAKQIFVDNGTCEVIDDKIEETIPWQIGTIKAYCHILLQNGCQQS